jgi:DNA-binding MarR family transcriptional regulator
MVSRLLGFPTMGLHDAQAGLTVVGLLLRCHRLQKELAASADLSIDEFHCLTQLYIHAPCCVKNLCEFTGIQPTRASKLLNVLEAKGYVSRALSVEDRRKESLTLTQAGTAVARSLLESCALSGQPLAESLHVMQAV